MQLFWESGVCADKEVQHDCITGCSASQAQSSPEPNKPVLSLMPLGEKERERERERDRETEGRERDRVTG